MELKETPKGKPAFLGSPEEFKTLPGVASIRGAVGLAEPVQSCILVPALEVGAAQIRARQRAPGRAPEHGVSDKTRSSSREVRIRVPNFFCSLLVGEPSPNKKAIKRALLVLFPSETRKTIGAARGVNAPGRAGRYPK